MGVSRTCPTTGAPIGYAADAKRRVQHIVCSTMARLASAISHHPPTRPPCTLRQSYTRPSLSLFIVVKYAYLSLYYIVLTCPILLLTYIYTTYIHLTRTYTHTHFYFGPAWFFGCVLLDMHTKSSPTVATVSAGQMSGLLQLHLTRAAPALHCTALAALHWHRRLGLDWMAALGLAAERASERASKAVELLRRAPGLPVCPSLTSGIGLLSTFKFLLTGSPRQFQPASPTHPSSPD